MAVKTSFYKKFDKNHKNSVNRSIRNVLFSLYARLGNIKPPKRKKKVYKWSKDDWNSFKKNIDKLAKPKKIKKASKKAPKVIRPVNEERINQLAKPNKTKIDVVASGWKFKESMKRQKPSARINKLALHSFRENNHYKDALRVNPAALKYKISDRVNELAHVSHGKYAAKEDVKIDAFVISPNALKYKATERIIELAEPNIYPEPEINEFKVSAAALKYKPTLRIRNLAKPKHFAKI